MSLRRTFVSAFAIALMIVSAAAFAQEADKVQCFTTWDENYFYLAAQVACPDIEGTHSLPNADISGDDSVTVYIQSDGARSATVTPRTFSMAISAAGGCQFMAGSDAGAFEPAKAFTFKYGVTLQGTINNNDDSDIGYTVEMALPWDLLNTKPPLSNEKLGFNVVVRRHGGKPNDFVSLSPRVAAESDIVNPSNWSSIVFGPYSFVAATTSVEKILSIRYIARVPLIDGTISEKEWHKNTSVSIAFPNTEGPAPEIKFAPHKQVLALYFVDKQCDHRRQPPFTDCLSPGVRFADFPPNNLGPWYSYDRVQWHKDMLAGMTSAKIDVAVPVIRSDEGLQCMVAALRELAVEGQPGPQVAPCVDVSAIAESENKAGALTQLLESFYQIVAPELRAIAQTGPPNPGRVAYPVLLTGAVEKASLSQTAEQLETELGRPIVWLGPANCEGCDGRFERAGANGGKADSEMRIRTGVVSPGYNDTGIVPSTSAQIASRVGGGRLDNAWQTVLKSGPHWIICDSWNSYIDGAELAESRQYGKTFIDKTRENVEKFRASRDFDVVYRRVDAPEVVAPAELALAEFTLKNVGNKPWLESEGVALGYRWYKDGRYFGESRAKIPILTDVNPGDVVNVNVGIATVDMQGDPMAEGAYVIRFEMIRDGKWLSSQGAPPFWLPITVGKAGPKSVSYLRCAIPTMMASGKSYPASVTVRNDSADNWAKSTTKLGVKLVKVPLPGSNEAPVEIGTSEIPFPRDCPAGQVSQIKFQLHLIDPTGAPVPAWKLGDPWTYQFVVDVFDGQKWLGDSGSPKLTQSPRIFSVDNTARLVAFVDLPAKLQAGKEIPVKIVLRNTGLTDWKAKTKQVFIGYHWYHLDGSELEWEGKKTPLKADLLAGVPGVVSVVVKAPAYDGRYVLVPDVYDGDAWLSTLPLTRGGDQLLAQVEVTGGRLTFLDLGTLADVAMSSPGSETTSGDFDGKGASFPGEYVPPESSQGVTPLAPTEYNLTSDPRPDGRISFSYSAKEPELVGAVRCTGQRLDVPKGKYVAVHILAASIDGSVQAAFSLLYGSTSTDVSVAVSDWGAAPKDGEVVGLFAGHRHNAAGDDPSSTCRLFDYKLAVDSTNDLTGLTLPKNAALRIAAITLEKAQ